MSAHDFSDQPDPLPPRSSAGARAAKAAAAVVAVAALAFGANAISKSDSSSASGSGAGTAASAATPGTSGQSGQSGQAPAGGAPTGAPPQMGTAVTGATLQKLTAAATAKYPGTVERAEKLSDGSYEVHVIGSNGTEVHVRMSKDLAVTGADEGGPGAGAPPAGSAAPSGDTSSA